MDGLLLAMRQAQSCELVICELPRPVVGEPENLGRGRSHFFWTVRSRPDTVAKQWRQRLPQVAQRTGVNGRRTHRLRDTLAVGLLLADLSIDDVSLLLGHGSVQTSERYYAPWDRPQRDRQARIVRDAHKRDPLLAEVYAGPAQEPERECSGVSGPCPSRATRFRPSAQASDFRPCTGFCQ